MNKYVIVVVSLLLFSACRENISVNVPELSDGDPTTCYTGAQGLNKIDFDTHAAFLSKVTNSTHREKRRNTIRQPGH